MHLRQLRLARLNIEAQRIARLAVKFDQVRQELSNKDRRSASSEIAQFARLDARRRPYLAG
jgi:hypothetical protein